MHSAGLYMKGSEPTIYPGGAGLEGSALQNTLTGAELTQTRKTHNILGIGPVSVSCRIFAIS
jgi:hypothetical protein